MSEPITATHISLETGEPLRVSRGVYAEVYMNCWWVECATLRNSDLVGGHDCIPGRAKPLHKFGWRKVLCNLRLFLNGLNYRV